MNINSRFLTEGRESSLNRLAYNMEGKIKKQILK